MESPGKGYGQWPSLERPSGQCKDFIFRLLLLLLAFVMRRAHGEIDMASSTILGTGLADRRHGQSNTVGAERRGRVAGRLASSGRATRLDGRPRHTGLGRSEEHTSELQSLR